MVVSAVRATPFSDPVYVVGVESWAETAKSYVPDATYANPVTLSPSAVLKLMVEITEVVPAVLTIHVLVLVASRVVPLLAAVQVSL